MLEFLMVILFCWLFFKALGLAFRAAWGTAKILASLLLAVAVPLLVICIVFAGGLLVLLPVALIGAAFGLLNKLV